MSPGTCIRTDSDVGFVLPAGLVPTTVPLSGVKAPVAAIAKPEMVEEAAFDVYANFHRE